ncbi:peptidylprolyl isomerase [Paenisporosarcina quisquiliarum]|uniref:Foldase protein PrsA n=1 Tax=Paenisporosarcina quisquiliarum TaxID=365346 RepID=A0A9X3RF06_9BACL|nr:peptidylprolyl isomerase [Paenisporosarcina quisquiliarum]MCZ8538439.1 peptidylprolyl isomerase [Paenisporosarcina quisquiliarum]
MKKTVLTLTLAASVLALSACNGDSAADDKAIVTSKAGDITKNELYEEMKESVGKQALQVLIIEKVLASEYEVTDKEVNAQFDKEKKEMGESFDQYLEQQGQTEKSYKKYIRLNLLQEKAMTEDVKVTDEEVKAQYENMKTEINARHVLVADEATAKEVKAKLDGGADFAAVAKEYSTEQAAQQSGGELGWFTPDKMVKEFSDAALALEVNKISEPVKSEFGFHIIQVTDKREADIGSFEDNKAEITKTLKMQKADQTKLLPKVSKLMKEADIEIKDEDLKGAIDQLLNPKEAEPAAE